MPTSRKPTWSTPDSTRYYGGHLGHVFKAADGQWGASWDGGFDTYKTRKEAMKRVEREVAKPTPKQDIPANVAATPRT